MLSGLHDATLNVVKCWVASGKEGTVYRVIVADDEPEFREWLRTLLSDSDDFELVGEAGTGKEAVRLIPFVDPDLVIADMYMPEPDGLEVARYVQHYFPSIKAILVSAYGERVYDRLARDEGALAFIPKARFSLNALRQALQEGEQPSPPFLPPASSR